MAKQPTIPPAPKLGPLAPYLSQLPPFIARKKVAYYTGGAISPKTLCNEDSKSEGPRVRQKIGDTIVYPTAFFLAYLEAKGVTTIVVPKL